MNVRISTIEITQRFVHASSLRFEDEPFVSAATSLCPEHSESKLERHVKTRRRRRLFVKLDARKIVEGVTAGTDQAKDTVQSALTARDFQCSAGNETEAADACDECQIEGFEFRIVWQVYESSSALRQRRTSAPLRGWRPLPLHSYFFLATAALRLPAAFARLVAAPGLKLTTRILRPSPPSKISSINFSIRCRRRTDTPRLLAVLSTEGKRVVMTAFRCMFGAYFQDEHLVKHNPLTLISFAGILWVPNSMGLPNRLKMGGPWAPILEAADSWGFARPPLPRTQDAGSTRAPK